MKILFVVSRFKKSGPTNQLFYLCNNLSSSHEVKVLTLSAENENSDIQRFQNAGFYFECVRLGSVRNFVINGRTRLKKYIDSFSPNIIHTQGIRPDLLVSTIKPSCPHIITARNFPFEDYLPKYGLIVGTIMSVIHFLTFIRFKYLISCSKTLHDKFLKFGIRSQVITNGTDIEKYSFSSNFNEDKKIFVIAVVGELNKRKNVIEILRWYKESEEKNKYQLRIFGSGPLYKNYKREYSNYSGIQFYGHSKNIVEELHKCDCMFSYSKSEGFPNSVLEGLCMGLPAILSDIPAHREIKKLLPDHVYLFNRQIEIDSVLSSIVKVLDLSLKKSISSSSRKLFDSKVTAEKYFSVYQKTLG